MKLVEQDLYTEDTWLPTTLHFEGWIILPQVLILVVDALGEYEKENDIQLILQPLSEARRG